MSARFSDAITDICFATCDEDYELVEYEELDIFLVFSISNYTWK